MTQQQNAISNSIPAQGPFVPQPINLNTPTTTATSSSSPHFARKEPQQPDITSMDHSNQHNMMEVDDEDVEVNVHDDDSPLDMRIATKQDSDNDSVRPSVIRRAPSFKETSNSPFDSSQSGSAGEFFIINFLFDSLVSLMNPKNFAWINKFQIFQIFFSV